MKKTPRSEVSEEPIELDQSNLTQRRRIYMQTASEVLSTIVLKQSFCQFKFVHWLNAKCLIQPINAKSTTFIHLADAFIQSALQMTTSDWS